MTLRLILMRHAKSDWSTPFSGDFDRPLNKRGRTSATLIGAWLQGQSYVPVRILCSAAARTRETLALVLAEITDQPNVEYSKNLYLASPESMFQSLLAVENADDLMIVAHNPGSAILASALVSSPPLHHRFRDYPTAATTIIEFEIDRWSDLTPGSGKVVDFVVPKDL